MNPLTDIIPSAYRKAVYAVYALAGVVLGALGIAYVAAEPTWLKTALAVYAFVGTALGATAHANTPARRRKG